MSILPYLAVAAVMSIILTLAVIGGYEVWRNIQHRARERWIKRAKQREGQPAQAQPQKDSNQ
ncbi:hypothetical protein [Comamonas sp. JUb58]|uniref:hypothetical protein n=1 Tax=Comamonas sp. JUb58 TaxID=2485114 RepID=UPI001060537F|nr:hypothetical protein [Comamonas sp. JUb58]TDS70448.1 hypothetical protein EDF71_13136 [Comamonas sp. JUb58]